MRTPSRWLSVASLSAPRVAALTERALLTWVREELIPFSEGYRARLAQARLEVVASRAALADLPPLTPAELLAAERDPEQRERFWLRPSASAIAARSTRVQRLVFRLGGIRAARALAWGYAPVTSFADGPGAQRGDRAQPNAAGPRFVLTPHDVALAAESGARALGELGQHRPGACVVLLAGPEDDLVRLALLQGAVQLGVRIEVVAPAGEQLATRLADARPTAILGAPDALADAAARTPARALAHVTVLGVLAADLPVAERIALVESFASARGHIGTPTGTATAAGALALQVAAVCAPAFARQLFAERPAPPEAPTGLGTYPDCGFFEVHGPDARAVDPGCAGEVVYTAVTGHGLPAFRYRTGLTTRAGLIVPTMGPQRLCADLR